MDHVVFFPAHDGSPAFRRVASLEDAVRLVEHLRNVEGVDHVSVHTLTEVPMSFKAYYRVEVPTDTPVAAEATAPVDAAPAPGTGPQFEVPQVVPAPAVVVPLQEQPAEQVVAAVAAAPATLGFFAR